MSSEIEWIQVGEAGEELAEAVRAYLAAFPPEAITVSRATGRSPIGDLAAALAAFDAVAYPARGEHG